MNDQQQNNLSPSVQDETNKVQGAANTNENTDSIAIYLDSSSLQTQAELQHQQGKKGDHSKEDKSITSSGVDDLQSNSNGAAGIDRAGAVEKKTYGDIDLNKGLEAQARDEES
ncbi:MAG TPA: hypothetical protein VKA92_14520 [Segetibacter sp.]|nr:hypothetical protein [Segetibacter sp.]